MKLDIKTDFTKLPRAEKVLRAADAEGAPAPTDVAVLVHDERHLRRKVLPLQHGGRVLVDLAEPVMLGSHDRLVLEDGSHVEVVAAQEELHEVRGRDRQHLAELCWHLGNRHLAAQVEEDRVLILRDHVIRDMLIGLDARVRDVVEPFQPLRGAYSGHTHRHHDQEHGNGHGQRDRHGRLPGDPHYGHDHG